MPDRIDAKWRPPLLLVLSCVLGAVLALPLAGLLVLRQIIEPLGFRHSALLIAAVILVVTAILAWLLWRLLLRPVTALAGRADAVRKGQPPVPMLHYGTQELRDLGQSVLTMAATLQNREATIRTFTDHVTHELKTPLTAIRGAAEILESSQLSDSDRRLAVTIIAACHRMETQLAALRQIAAAREPSYHGQCRLGDIIVPLQTAHPAIMLRSEGAAISLPLAAEGLQIVLQHMLANAAAHGATAVTLSAAPQQLTVQDDGDGISAGNRDRVFAPFFTTRRDAGGTGMGLSIVQNLLAAHGATIVLLPCVDGARFCITFDPHGDNRRP